MVDIPARKQRQVLDLTVAAMMGLFDAFCVIKGFLALFPGGKSAKIGPHSGSELSADFSSSTPPWRHVVVVALWTLELALLGPQKFFGDGPG